MYGNLCIVARKGNGYDYENYLIFEAIVTRGIFKKRFLVVKPPPPFREFFSICYDFLRKKIPEPQISEYAPDCDHNR